MNRVSFFCELPPPFGGVTVKNKLLIDEIFASLPELEIIDFSKIKYSAIQLIPVSFKMLRAFIRKDVIVYGFGSYKRLYMALKIQKTIGGVRSLSRCVNIVMGGTLADSLKVHAQFDVLLRSIKINLVETDGLKNALSENAIANTDVFPNPKPSKGARQPVKNSGALRCVFFSKICEEKGCSYIIDELGEIDGDLITIDFYGHIDEKIKTRFISFVETHSNINYHGVFDSAENDVYAELNQYDVLLFPTTWVGEGVPGILIESKMSGVLPVVSDWNYNREIVRDETEGIVLNDLNQGTLRAVILSLARNSDKVYEGKIGSFRSRNRYSLENYRESLIEMVSNESDR